MISCMIDVDLGLLTKLMVEFLVIEILSSGYIESLNNCKG